MLARRLDQLRPTPDATTPPDAHELWLRLVGGFAVYRAGRIQPATQVGSRKARTLLALLAVAGWRFVRADSIAMALWRDGPPRQPADNVATLVSRLRATLGPDTIVGGRAGYRLGDAVRVDLHDAAGLVDDAETRLDHGEPGAALGGAQRALTLLADPILVDDASAAWVEPAHALHTGLLRRARRTVAEAALRVGDAPTAVAAAEAAVLADQLDEAAYRTLMLAHDLASEPARALTTYERLRATLADELGVDPAPPTRRLHATILQCNAVIGRPAEYRLPRPEDQFEPGMARAAAH